MSISTKNTNRPGGNQINRPNKLQNNFAPRTNNFFQHQEEKLQNLVDETAAIDDTENFQ